MKTIISMMYLIPLIFYINLSDALEFDELDDNDVYFSPTRLKQSLHDTPSSVTKITSEQIKKLQILKIPDLFKYVAGMSFDRKSGNDYKINYHGTNGLIPRRMQVLINGISVYRPSYASVSWSTLPISINDIDFVEIIRSPSTATYGANSMMAVINIATKKPLDTDKAGIVIIEGEQGTSSQDVYFRGDIQKNIQYRISLSAHSNNGFDKNNDGENRRDSSDIKRFNSEFEYKFSPKTKGRTFIGYSDTVDQIEIKDPNQTASPDLETESLYFMSSINHTLSNKHDMVFKLYSTHIDHKIEWNTCYPTILFSQNLRNLFLQNSDYATALVNQQIPTGGSAEDDALRDAVLAELATLGAAAFSPSCGDVNENGTEKRYDFELQDTYIFSDNLRVVSGLGYTEKNIDSQTFLNGNETTQAYRAFGNAEIRWQNFVFNLGTMIEYEKDILNEPAYSPRIGANYRINEKSTLRFIYSKAKRTPDILEDKMNWNYTITNLTPAYPTNNSNTALFYFNARGNSNLKSEEITAREISLYANSTATLNGKSSIGYNYDLKLFHNTMEDLISEKPAFFNYNLTNNGSVTLSGFEADINASLNKVFFKDHIESINLHFNYAYIDTDTDEFNERILSATHTGSTYAIFNFHNHWFTSLAYYGNSEMAGETLDAWEFGLGKTRITDNSQLTLKAKVAYFPDKIDNFTDGPESTDYNINDQSTYFFFTIDYSIK